MLEILSIYDCFADDRKTIKTTSDQPLGKTVRGKIEGGCYLVPLVYGACPWLPRWGPMVPRFDPWILTACLSNKTKTKKKTKIKVFVCS